MCASFFALPQLRTVSDDKDADASRDLFVISYPSIIISLIVWILRHARDEFLQMSAEVS